MGSNAEIFIKGARQHNLKNVDIKIPKNQLVVFTGVSGSGKSSLCIDTLFAEGQRRYVESLSSYARQFLNRMDKPDVDYINGICPAIAVEQKVTTRSSRSTVGSLTEIYDYLRLLFARIGKTYSPKSGKLVKKHDESDVVKYLTSFSDGTKAFIYFTIQLKRPLEEELNLLLKKGFVRFKPDDRLIKIEDFLDSGESCSTKKIKVLIDRLVIKSENEELGGRIADSAQAAFFEGFGDCQVEVEGEQERSFSNRFELDGMEFEQPSPHFFNFNSPFGACKTCEGFGTVVGIDHDLVIPDPSLSVFQEGIAAWRGEKMRKWLEKLLNSAELFDFPIHRPIAELSEEERELLWTGNKHFKGLNRFFKYLEEKAYKIQYRVMLSRYKGRAGCPDCRGSRLRADSAYVKIGGKSIIDLLLIPVKEVIVFFDELELSKHDQTIGKRIIAEITARLQFLSDVGLEYLTLNRMSNTLSGGETQRINLTRCLGSNLTNSLYILDEPSIGLHPRDTERLILVLKALRDLGNSVLVVEHDEDIIRSSDHIVDMGPEAGVFGGEVVYNGPAKKLKTNNKGLTAQYLHGKMEIELPERRRKFINKLKIKGATQHNLKNIDATFPLQAMTVVSGVSGSGKTTLIKQILYPAVRRHLEEYGERPGMHHSLTGDLKRLSSVEMIDQNPIGKSSRSNPVTYVKAYDGIRELFAAQQLSKIRGYKAKDFSFNVEGGRCEECKGEGEVIVEMQFLADVRLKCEHCDGKRFKEDVLEVRYKGKSIFDVLELSIDEALIFFEEKRDVKNKLQPLMDVGLGYVRLGQSSNTLSGGEAQRVKLASFLSKKNSKENILFIFDEPTTGLHFHDIKKLLKAFDELIKMGHTLVVIEHNIDIIKCADWIIDLGPEGGKNGGNLLYEGEPAGLVEVDESHTGRWLAEKLT